MTSKKWFVILLSLTLAVVIVFGAMTYFLDPLLQYGNERGPLTSREYTEMYSNPGIAKNYDYNAVFVGSSMVENANVSELDELFDCKTIKVPYSGASSYNHKHILDVCYDSGQKIDYVFWALDEYALTTDYMTPRYPLPEYLYDEDWTNDPSYLLNLDIFYFYTMKDIFNTVKGNQQIMMKDGSWVEDESVYCKKNALSSFTYTYLIGIGEQQEELVQYITENGLSDTFHLLGFKDNPYKYVAKADLFVCSSRREGFSTAVTESLIVGTPVVSTNCSGANELLGKNNEYGIVTENDEEALYEGIKSLLEHPEMLAHYKEKAKERGKMFSTEKTVKAVEDMLLSL